jgi:hypothetical protein
LPFRLESCFESIGPPGSGRITAKPEVRFRWCRVGADAAGKFSTFAISQREKLFEFIWGLSLSHGIHGNELEIHRTARSHCSDALLYRFD